MHMTAKSSMYNLGLCPSFVVYLKKNKRMIFLDFSSLDLLNLLTVLLIQMSFY